MRKPSERRKRPGAVWVTIFAFGIPVLLLLHYGLTWWLATRMLQRETERVRQSEIGSREDVKAKLMPPRTPGNDRRARRIREALQRMSDIEADSDLIGSLPIEGNGSLPEPDEPIPPEMMAGMARRLLPMEPMLQTLREEAGPDIAIITLEESFDTARMVAMAVCTRMRMAARLLAMSAVLHAGEGNDRKAVDDIIAGIRLSETLQGDPTLLGRLVEHAVLGLPIASLKQVLARTNPDEEMLDDLDTALRDIPSTDVSRLLQTERIWCVENASAGADFRAYLKLSPSAGLKSFDRPLALLWFRYGPAWPLLDSGHVLRVYRNLIDIQNLDEEERGKEISRLLKELRDFPGARGLIAQWDLFAEKLARRDAWIANARVAVAAQRFLRRENPSGSNEPEALIERFARTLPPDLRESVRFPEQEQARSIVREWGTRISIISEDPIVFELAVTGPSKTARKPPRLRVYQRRTPDSPFPPSTILLRPDSRKGLWGFVDRDGNAVIPHVFLEARPFSEGLAAVRKETGWGFVDPEGEMIVPCAYDEVGDFKGGLASVTTGGFVGFVDTNGVTAIEPRFMEIGPFSEGLAAARQSDGRYGFIDLEGRWVIQPRFEAVGPFSEGLAAAKEPGGRYGYIDSKGKWVIRPAYYTANPFSDGRAMVSTSSGFDIIDRTGALEASFPALPPGVPLPAP